jgi:hypothetical protein
LVVGSAPGMEYKGKGRWTKRLEVDGDDFTAARVGFVPRKKQIETNRFWAGGGWGSGGGACFGAAGQARQK